MGWILFEQIIKAVVSGLVGIFLKGMVQMPLSMSLLRRLKEDQVEFGGEAVFIVQGLPSFPTEEDYNYLPR